MQLDREVDWVIKQQLIQGYMDKNRLSWRDPKVSLIDLQYHDIRPDKGLYWSLAQRGLVDRITSDDAIERAKHEPPQTTRARLRGEFIRQANLKGKDYRVDWVYLKLNDPERETILCKDPFQSHDERVERLIRSFLVGGASRPPPRPSPRIRLRRQSRRSNAALISEYFSTGRSDVGLVRRSVRLTTIAAVSARRRAVRVQ